MISRLGSYLASRPKTTAVLVLALAAAFILVLAGLAFELSHFGRAPYPSQELGFSLANGNVLYTQINSYFLGNQTSNTRESLCPYAGAKISFMIDGSGIRGLPFGNASRLSTGNSATVTQWFFGGTNNASIDITDSTGNGAFEGGDTILFKLVPLREDTVYVMGLAFYPLVDYPSLYTEMSFAIHDGKLYSWLSHDLSPEWP